MLNTKLQTNSIISIQWCRSCIYKGLNINYMCMQFAVESAILNRITFSKLFTAYGRIRRKRQKNGTCKINKKTKEECKQNKG